MEKFDEDESIEYIDLELIEEEIRERSLDTDKSNETECNKPHSNKIIRYVARTFAMLGLTLSLLIAGIYGAMCMLVYGPSPTAGELFVMSVQETSAIGFLANWFYSQEEIDAILSKNSIKDSDAVTDTSLVAIANASEVSATVGEVTPDIEVIDVKGATYRGKLMVIKDPSRVFVGTVPTFSEDNGLVVSNIAKRYNAIGGINAGEFVDGNTTYTAMPVGLVMTSGKIVNGDTTTMCHVTGFTSDNILVVGNMTGQQALNMGVRDCVSISNSIGPFLIINGEAQDVSGVGGGINPRTAIGQRADGAILLLVVDGRQANSLGATFADLLYIMQENGAVNASTMDGGTSTQMYYDGEVINSPYSPTGPRQCPTAFLVGGIN